MSAVLLTLELRRARLQLVAYSVVVAIYGIAVAAVYPTVLETTGMGAAFLAGLGAGVWSSQDEVAQAWSLDRRFEPGSRDEHGYRRWRAAVARSKGWADLVD